jgi:hypothetical protein
MAFQAQIPVFNKRIQSYERALVSCDRSFSVLSYFCILTVSFQLSNPFVMLLIDGDGMLVSVFSA